MQAAALDTQEIPEMSVSSRLKQGREEAGLSRKKLGELTGIPAKTIEKFEYGTSEPSLSRLKTLCTTLGISFHEIMAEVDAQEPQSYAARGASRGRPRELPADQLAKARRKIEDAAEILGGKVFFDPHSDDGEEESGENVPHLTNVPHFVRANRFDPVLIPGEDRLIAIRDLVSKRGIKAARLPRLVKAAKDELGNHPLGHLVCVASAFDCRLDICLSDEEMERRETINVDEQQPQCQRVEDCLIVEAVYGKDFRNLSVAGLNQLAEAVNDLYDEWIHSSAVDTEGWFEDAEVARLRLLRELPEHLVRAAMEGAPIELPRLPNEGVADEDDE